MASVDKLDPVSGLHVKVSRKFPSQHFYSLLIFRWESRKGGKSFTENVLTKTR